MMIGSGASLPSSSSNGDDGKQEKNPWMQLMNRGDGSSRGSGLSTSSNLGLEAMVKAANERVAAAGLKRADEEELCMGVFLTKNYRWETILSNLCLEF
jgi:hypothetical protein